MKKPTLQRNLLALLLAAAWLSPAALGQQSGGNPESGDQDRQEISSPSDRSASAAAGNRGRPVEDRDAVGAAVARAQSEKPLRFSFRGTSWGEVLEWFAEEAELSLQMDQVPQGTVNFVDPERNYSITEGLDVLNRLLLTRGWALVRDGRMLRVIDLEAQNASKLIRETAELVSSDQFDSRGESDIVTCIFSLGGMSPDSAREELAEMVGPWGDVVVLDSARKVKITETVAKQRAIQDVLEASRDSIVTIQLENRGAVELLEIARPLLGLEPGENANDDIRISVSIYGDQIFATGLPGKLGLLEDVIAQADTPLELSETAEGGEAARPELVTHNVSTADVNTVFDVLQTLLAGLPDARIAIEPKTNAIVASARPETQELISKTIGELEGRGTSFEVIDLRRLEPSQALLTINKFFGVTEEGGDGPIVDGDPATGRLWVRGTAEQIKIVKELIAELEGEDSLGQLGENVRVLPYTGRTAEDAINQIRNLWPLTGRENRIRTVTPGRGPSSARGLPERRLHGTPSPQEAERQAERPVGIPEASFQSDEAAALQFVTAAPQSVSAGQETDPDEDRRSDDGGNSGDEPAVAPFENEDIVIQMTPAGLVIASRDAEALDALEALMQSLGQPNAMQAELPTIYWLRYVKADVAAELISSVLGGAESTSTSLGESVIGGLGGGMLGGLLGIGGDDEGASSARSVLTSTGSVNIVSDARLNALIIQANPADLQFVDMVLEKIDVQESPEDIDTTGKPALIPVIYQDAAAVADIVKSVYADRIAGQEQGGGGRGGDGGGRPSPEDFFAALRGGRGGRGGGRGGGGGDTSTKSEPTKISVAVDSRSNSLVVTASPQDFLEVRQLVEALDQQGMETSEDYAVVAIPGALRSDAVKQALESVLGQQASTSDSSGGSTSSGGGRSGRDDDDAGEGPSPEEIQQRIQAFRSRFGGGAGRGGAAGGGRGGFGGGFGGGRGGFGGGRGGGFGGRAGGGGR